MCFYVSRNETLKNLEAKIARCLSNYLYTVMKNKDTVVKKMRIWKSINYDLDATLQLD